MPDRNLPPSLCGHKPSKQGVVTLNGRDCCLGHWPDGERKPPAAVHVAYDALIAEWLGNSRRPLSEQPPALGIAELILQFWARQAVAHYRHPDGSPTSELEDFKCSLRPLREIYGRPPACEFTPLKLKAIRQKMIEAGLSGKVINQRVGRIKRLFKWAVGEELVPETVHRALMAVEGLKAGRPNARESGPVGPVPDEHVAKTLPLLLRPIRGLILVQRLTGMQPSEAARMRACDIDMTGEVWVYRPTSHKTAWRAKGASFRSAPGPRSSSRDTSSPSWTPTCSAPETRCSSVGIS